MVDVFGADHGGYVKRIKASVLAMTDRQGEADVRLCQMVNFMENGVPMKMSKRAGTFTTVRDVVDAVGKDVLRFIMLTRKNDAPLDFDLQKVLEQSKENPVFYVQYAHARACSVLRTAEEEDISLSRVREREVRLDKNPKDSNLAAAGEGPHPLRYGSAVQNQAPLPSPAHGRGKEADLSLFSPPRGACATTFVGLVATDCGIGSGGT